MKKMNNKGFSLVELIVVIAIMAVLVGVLAPQFIKYVESSRRSTDISSAESIRSAILADIADQDDDFFTEAHVSTKATINDALLPSSISAAPTVKSSEKDSNEYFEACWSAKHGTCDVYVGAWILTDANGALDYKNQDPAGTHSQTPTVVS